MLFSKINIFRWWERLQVLRLPSGGEAPGAESVSRWWEWLQVLRLSQGGEGGSSCSWYTQLFFLSYLMKHDFTDPSSADVYVIWNYLCRIFQSTDTITHCHLKTYNWELYNQVIKPPKIGYKRPKPCVKFMIFSWAVLIVVLGHMQHELGVKQTGELWKNHYSCFSDNHKQAMCFSRWLNKSSLGLVMM